METLLQNDHGIDFLIDFEEQDFEISATFSVYEVTSWDGETGEPVDKERYLKGYIKWDGCSHIWFGEEEGQGYIHLCGKRYFDRHKEVMDAIWEMCSKKIKGFDPVAAE